MTKGTNQRLVAATILALFLTTPLTGCSNDSSPNDEPPGDVEDPTVSTVPTASLQSADGDSDQADDDNSAPMSDETDESASAADGASDPQDPVRRGAAPGVSDGSHWLGHGDMTDTSISLTWSSVPGDQVDYRIFRFETADSVDLETVPLNQLFHETSDATDFVDTEVTTGTFYSYVLQVTVDGETLERRWTTTLAVTDVTAPSGVGPVSAEVRREEVVLGWQRSSDDVEFGSYGVYRTEGPGDPQYIGGGADLAQTAFIDDQVPPSGRVSYEVVAFDFHGNRSQPSRVEVDLDP